MFFILLVLGLVLWFYMDNNRLIKRYKKGYENIYYDSINTYVSTVEFVRGNQFFTKYGDTTEYLIHAGYDGVLIPSQTYIVKKRKSFIIQIDDSSVFNNKFDSPFFEEFNSKIK